MEKQNTISAHVIQFCRFLRSKGYNLGPQEEAQALEALRFIPYSKPSYFKNALKTSLVKSKNQLDSFDDFYLQYWSEIRKAENSKQKQIPEEKEFPKPKPSAPSIQVIKKWLHGKDNADEVKISSYDTSESFTEQDFTAFSKDNLKNTLKYSKDLVRKLSNRKGRRYIPAKNDNLVDLRKIIRQNIGRSDELIFLKFKKRKKEKLKLVLICDVSRSMEMYARFLIQFMYGLNQASTQIETFVFSTRLSRITKSLKEKEFSKVLEDLKTSFDGWSGGTKIGESLSQFTDQYSSAVINQKTKIIILSDGWDTGDVDLVEASMLRLSRKSQKVIWLNPLAGNPNFRPETACLKAALPYINVFQAANSVEDLQALIKVV